MELHRLGEDSEPLTVESTHVSFDVTTVENSSVAHRNGHAEGDPRAPSVAAVPSAELSVATRVRADQIDRTRRRAGVVGALRGDGRTSRASA
jgi:hypothetical protein